MKNVAIRWQAVSRNDLLDVLLGEQQPTGVGRLMLPSSEMNASMVAAGYADEVAIYKEYRPPSIIVLADDGYSETLSWLRAYASEASPLSQYARVVLASDWRSYGTERKTLVEPSAREDHWASVIVGETLSQGDAETDIEALPLSRGLGCFSMPVARAALIYGAGEATKTCVDRLKLIEGDSRFARRAVTVDSLLPIWAISGADLKEATATDAALFVLDAASRYMGFPIANDQQRYGLDALYSDSVESRVVAFNQLSSQVLQDITSSRGKLGVAGVTLAAAAFLVGRGTSHSFLLKRVAREVPASLAWFGLIAAKAGSRSWDPNWLRAVKGIERLLRADFDWLEPPTADLSWAEFSWIASTFEGADMFGSLPKMLPRTLAVEVLPGASCQFRLATSSSGADGETRQRVSSPFHERQQLVEILSHVMGAARGLQAMLPSTGDVPQKPLEFGTGSTEGIAPWKPAPKNKKPRR